MTPVGELRAGLPFAFAQGIELKNPLQADTFEELVEGIINFIFNLALVVAPIMIIVSGFILVTSGGDPAARRRAKEILIYTVAGLFVIMTSKGLIQVLKELFEN